MTTTNNDIDFDTVWEAGRARDTRFDGQVFFAVVTTRIYCRPSCPSRPKRENVRLFASADDAENAGFRACLRCRPRDTESPAERLVGEARRLLEADEAEGISLTALAASLGVSAGYLQRLFKRLSGLSPREYAAARRLDRFKSQLRAGSDVTAATYEAGYGSTSRVYEQASPALGMTPSRYRDGGAGLAIRYAVRESRFGLLLLAATARGACFVALGQAETELERALRSEFPRATIARGGEDLAHTADAVLEYLNGHGAADAPALDLRGSAFQLLVWKALRGIPAGQTRSYGQLARELGRPGAARAVANACAANPAALLVPCHRAVRADGRPGGYRWGSERKLALLAAEADAAERP
jgi:AraC family transcriptional regulator of adaptative response/methylated-DNA-[protein]-cysteine methyltransferase